MRLCPKCKLRSKQRGKAYCKCCHNELERERYQSSPQVKAVVRARWLKRRYGITVEQYNKMFTEQEGKCLGCLRHQSEFTIALSVDHNHTTGAIRRLLCSGCNLALGNIEENPDTLIRLAELVKAVA